MKFQTAFFILFGK